MIPSQWDKLSDDDKAEMMAKESVLSDMKAYEYHLEEEKRLRNEARQNLKRK